MPLHFRGHSDLIATFRAEAAIAQRNAQGATRTRDRMALESEARTWLSAAGFLEKAVFELEIEAKSQPGASIRTWQEQVAMGRTTLGYTDWFTRRLEVLHNTQRGTGRG